MRSVVSLLLLIIAGSFLVIRQVKAAPENSGGLGDKATSLCAELVEPNGYTCIEHKAVTGDGFILGLQNLPAPRGQPEPETPGRPVLLQHGLTASLGLPAHILDGPFWKFLHSSPRALLAWGGDNFVANGPVQSLAFVLADAGFDVWITNSRAIQWSHGHESLVPSDPAYWAWSYDELASYDLLAIVEYVSNKRGGIQVSYVGHSLGTTIMFAGLTGGRFKSQILPLLNAVVMLAPIAFSSHISIPLLIAGLVAYSSPLVHVAPAAEYSTYEESVFTCGIPVVNPALCYAAVVGSVGPNNYMDESLLSFYNQYFPQPSSTYNFNHLGQGYVNANFAFFDEGTVQNIAAYGQATPPNYDLTTFPAWLPVQYWSGGIDGLANPTDTAKSLGLLPSSNREVNELPTYGHLDFVFGTHSYIDVYPGIIRYLNEHTQHIYCETPPPSPAPTSGSPPPPPTSGSPTSLGPVL